MKISKLPPAAIDRLVAVDQHADKLARRAAIDESEVAAARSLINGHSKADPAAILRARNEFPELLKKAQASRLRADTAMRTASTCKAFVDGLLDDVLIEEVAPPQPNGLDLDGVRSRCSELRAEIGRIKSLPAPSDRHLVEQFVDEIRRPAEAQIREMVKRWPHFCSAESLRLGDAADVDIALMTAIFPRDAMVTCLLEKIDAIADAAMPPSERPTRIAELEGELAALQSLEVMFVDRAVANGQTDVAHDPPPPPAILLGITVVERRTQLAS